LPLFSPSPSLIIFSTRIRIWWIRIRIHI
jgi:hypothetical protein